MTTAIKRRRLAQQESLIEGQWLNAWTDWGKAVMQAWMSVGPKARERHDTLYQPLYQEWAKAVMEGHESSFVSRGAVLAKWWPSAPALWGWLWEVQRGWLEHDLRKWPNRLPDAPEVPDGMLQKLLAEAKTAEDCALLMAVVARSVDANA